MKFFVGISLIIFNSHFLSAKCVPARLVVDYPEDLENIGLYHRVHPSGNYILASKATAGSTENRVAIIDLTNKDPSGKIIAKTIFTPMIDETYPVEGTWTLLASPRHMDGMRYYKFSDILSQQDKAEPVTNDSGHSQWYHSSAELPGSTPSVLQFRTMLYGQPFRDYTLTFDKSGKLIDKATSETKDACKNLGIILDSPILSKDGTEIGATVKDKTVIYKLREDGSCDPISENIGYFTSKVNFSYPKNKLKGSIVFKAQGTILINDTPDVWNGITLYDRDKKEVHKLSLPSESNPSYPGMTKDGRVIYVTKDREIIIVDPNQLQADGTESNDKSKCIQEQTSASSSGKSTTSPAIIQK